MRDLEALARQSQVGLAEIWLWPEEQLRKALPWPAHLFQALDLHRREWGVAPSIQVPDEALLPIDSFWPDGLRSLKRPPLALFWKGRAALWRCLGDRQAVAIVGTRQASPHGVRVAEEFGQALAHSGWPVVSGLAEGVDAAAHRGCLKAGGVPVAVLGTPLNRAYPLQHAALQSEVESAGLLLTEQPKNVPVQRAYFAARNRLLVGLVKLVVVVECPERSGALISARLAFEMNCPVGVVPGDARRWSAAGSNALLLDRAFPLLSPESLLSQLGAGPLAKSAGAAELSGEAELSGAAELADSERVEQVGGQSQHEKNNLLLRALGDGASMKDLVECLKLPPGKIAEDLLQLELQGLLVAEPGLRWRPA